MNNIDSYIEALESYKITEDEIATEGSALKSAGVVFLGGLVSLGLIKGHAEIKKIIDGSSATSKIYTKNNKVQEYNNEDILKAYTAILNDITNSKYNMFYISKENIDTINTYKKDVLSKFKAAIQSISPKLSKYLYLKDKFEKYKTPPNKETDKKTISELKNIKTDLCADLHINRNMYSIDFNKSNNRESISKNDLVMLLKIPEFEALISKASSFEKYLSTNQLLDLDEMYMKNESIVQKYDNDEKNPLNNDNVYSRVPLFAYMDFMNEYNSLAKFIVLGPCNIFTNFFKVLNHISTKK